MYHLYESDIFNHVLINNNLNVYMQEKFYRLLCKLCDANNRIEYNINVLNQYSLQSKGKRYEMKIITHNNIS